MTLIIVFLVLLFVGVPIAYCLGGASVVTMLQDDFILSIFSQTMYSGAAKSSLLAIPFFILAGVVMEKSGISKKLIDMAKAMIGHVFGGLAVVTVVVSCFFAAISGSGPATVAALAPTLIPAMEEAGYRKEWGAALVANGGNIGIIIPPSVVFVIYGVIAEVSIGELFIAGIIPGIIIGACLIIAAIISLKIEGRKTNKVMKTPKASGKEVWRSFKDAFWGILSPVIILGGIYSGIFTPTESAAVAAVYSLIVGLFIYRTIKFKDLWRIFVDSAVSTAVVMFIIANASMFSYLLTTTGLASTMSNAIISVSSSKWIILLAINIVLLIAGMFVDTGSAMYIFIPILLPVIKAIGYDPLVFGVIATVNLAIGMATPPVGLDLYVACNASGVRFKSICKETMRFVFAGLIGLMILTYIPQITQFLPSFMN